MPVTFGVLALVTLVGVVLAALLWPADDPDVIEHRHADGDHVHLAEGEPIGPGLHSHAFTIDQRHPHWPV